MRLRLPPSDLLTAGSTVAVYNPLPLFVILTTFPDELDELLDAARWTGVSVGAGGFLNELLDASDELFVRFDAVRRSDVTVGLFDTAAAAAGRVGAADAAVAADAGRLFDDNAAGGPADTAVGGDATGSCGAAVDGLAALLDRFVLFWAGNVTCSAELICASFAVVGKGGANAFDAVDDGCPVDVLNPGGLIGRLDAVFLLLLFSLSSSSLSSSSLRSALRFAICLLKSLLLDDAAEFTLLDRPIAGRTVPGPVGTVLDDSD